MSQASVDFVKECKIYIDRGYFQALEAFVMENLGAENLAWEYILQKVYIHACLRKLPEVAEKIIGYLPLLDPIQQIAIRQTVPYGKWLLQRQ